MEGYRNALVRQKDIARNLGVSPAAVSMALRNHPRVSETLKISVRAEAARLKYRPDPALSALSSYRGTYARRLHSIVLLMPSHEYHKEVPWFKKVYDGICERVDELGYDLEVMSYPRNIAEERVMQRRLHNTGIKGILLGPCYSVKEPRFPVDGYALVRLSHSIGDSRLSISSHDHFQGMELACEQARERGYRNLVYLYDSELERRLGNRWLAAFTMKMMHSSYMNLQMKSFAASHKCFCISDPIRKYLTQAQPDCIIASMNDMLSTTFLGMEEDLNRWKKIGRISLYPEETTDAKFSGIRQNLKELGRVGVDLLHGQLMDQKTGYPEHALRVYVPGTWFEGCTLPRLLPAN